MATFFDGTTIGYWNSRSNNLYGRLVGNVSRSGNTVTLSGMTLNWWPRQSSYGTSDFTFTVNGTSTGARISPTGSMGLNNTSFGVSQSATSKSVGWSSSDGYSGSFTVSFSSGYSGTISSPTIPVITAGTTSLTGQITCANLGGGSSNKEVSLEVWPTSTATSGQPHRFTQSFTTANSVTNKSLTVNNSSSSIAGGITLVENHAYWLVGYISNSTASNSPKRGSAYKCYTLAKAPTVTNVTSSHDRITFEWEAPADSGALGKTVEYSIDGGTSWYTIDTVQAGVTTAKSGTYSITGLTPGTPYAVSVRITTSAGSNLGYSDTVSTQQMPFYGPVSGDILDGTVDGVVVTAIDNAAFTREVSVAGVTLADVDHAVVTYDGSYTITVYDENDTVLVSDSKQDPAELFGVWGLTVTLPMDSDGSITFTLITGATVTKYIKKLYAPMPVLSSVSLSTRTSEAIDLSVTDSTTFFNKLVDIPEVNQKVADGGSPAYLQATAVYDQGATVTEATLHGTNGPTNPGVWSITLLNTGSITALEDLMTLWGIDCTVAEETSGSAYVDITPTYSHETKRVTKFYGSVNGLTKKVF